MNTETCATTEPGVISLYTAACATDCAGEVGFLSFDPKLGVEHRKRWTSEQVELDLSDLRKVHPSQLRHVWPVAEHDPAPTFA